MAPFTEDKTMNKVFQPEDHIIAWETEEEYLDKVAMYGADTECEPLTWNDTDGVPVPYNDLYYYKTDTVFGVVYGDLEFAIRALRAGVQVTPIFNKI